jgi:glycine dehydrogenase subunit 1
MRYIPNTNADIQEMLSEMGCKNVEELFEIIPNDVLLREDLKLPNALSEYELLHHMMRLSEENANAVDYRFFLGGGVYHHFIPSVVKHLTSRSEFYTSYTPYQPEISQGTLQAMFEYQTLVCMLLGMEVSNASLYDGATSVAESVLMALRLKKKPRIVVSKSVHPDYRKVLDTYCSSNENEIIEIPYDAHGMTDMKQFKEAVASGVSCAVLQSPNFFGVVEDLKKYGNVIHENDALFVAAFSEPLAFGVLKPPGNFDADICCGEGQSLGIPMGFGGPYLGILTAKKQFVRNMPGRIVGRTEDNNGKQAYVLTLSAREQHIRREKAKSNVCTNQGLCALMATVYLSGLGKTGLRRVSEICHSRSEYAKEKLSRLEGVTIRFSSPTYNEFVVQLEADSEKVTEKLLEEKIVCGIQLEKFYPELGNCILLTFTETNASEDIDTLCKALKHAVK